jgi:hypothetical protein
VPLLTNQPGSAIEEWDARSNDDQICIAPSREGYLASPFLQMNSRIVRKTFEKMQPGSADPVAMQRSHMIDHRKLIYLLAAILFLGLPRLLKATDLDTIGVTLLRQVDSTLQGSGVRVAIPEGTSAGNDFQVNPAVVGQPVSLFTYYTATGTATTFPNALGVESWHADLVAGNFIGLTNGVAPKVSHFDNYESDH